MKINILIDNPKSWLVPYARVWVKKMRQEKHVVNFVFCAKDVSRGDCLFILGCEKIVSRSILNRNRHNLVVHESLLPQGKGWSPLTWQILEGKNKIPITLFEAAKKVDAGKIYLRSEMSFEGHELVDELRERQAQETFGFIKKFICVYPNIAGKKQHGRESFYRRRTAVDSEINPQKTIAEQFDLLRVVDNDRYPAFFHFLGHKYIIKIDKEN